MSNVHIIKERKLLALTRVQGQRIYIGEDIIVTILENNLQTGVIKLGFTAPPDVLIDREEIRIRRDSGWTLPKYFTEDDIKCQLKHNTKL